MRVALFVVLAFVAVAAARTTFKGSNLDARSSFLRGLLERKGSQEAKGQIAEDIAKKIKEQLKQTGGQTEKKDVEKLRSVLLKKTNRFSAFKRTESEEEDDCSAYPPECNPNDEDFWDCAVDLALDLEAEFGIIYYIETDGMELFSECMMEELWYYRQGDHCLTLEEVLNFESLYDYLAIEKFTAIWTDLSPATQEEVSGLACRYGIVREQAYTLALQEEKK